MSLLWRSKYIVPGLLWRPWSNISVVYHVYSHFMFVVSSSMCLADMWFCLVFGERFDEEHLRLAFDLFGLVPACMSTACIHLVCRLSGTSL